MIKGSNKIQASFDGQRDGERLLFVFRKHIIAMRKGFYMLAVPFLIAALPSLFKPGELLYLWVALGGLGVGLVLFSYQYIMWYFTVYIVTNQRIRQVTQKGFFGKNIIDLNLSKVQNISYNVPGFTGEMLHFGTIVIRTLVGDLVINKVEHPSRIYNKLQDAVANASDSREDEKDLAQD